MQIRLGSGGRGRGGGREEEPSVSHHRDRPPPAATTDDVQQHVPHHVRSPVRERGRSAVQQAQGSERREESIGSEL